ncbi:MAG: O-acetyl-ADP-ribose deacetylase [Hyphomicrobiaceae bacterium]|nr:O-acetyl-ADP-ribose deacetylase [Hyphomicrobiaceae bacterium]
MEPDIQVIDADITTLDVDAIVNAANAELAPGGGVCGAIHAAAGPELAKECASLGGCPTGEARITGGYNLPAKWVIHAVGPVWGGGESGEDGLLRNCYVASLGLAQAHDLASIAFPAISTGIYGFPAPRAAEIAVQAAFEDIKTYDTSGKTNTIGRIVFCCFGADSARLHQASLDALRS